MSAKAVMCQGTGSHVGKSVVVAALCRLYARDGYRVAPFKAQNMSNNSFVTADGGEMGRAQVFQAQAAGVEPVVNMNPILLKPDADTRAQVVRLGQPVSAMQVREYHDYQALAWPAVTGAYDQLSREYDLIVLEGAGSPAEINLRDRDIVNMKMAQYARSPVILIGDIERGGVFASLYGTVELLDPDERRMVKAFLINKFRGDASLLDSGYENLAERTSIPVLGTLPYVFGLPVDEEDAVVLQAAGGRVGTGVLDIGVIHLPHISNATDFQPLATEVDVTIRYIESAESFGRPDVVILPGTKSTVADFEWMQRQGLARLVEAHRQRGGWTIGICGGYQMLGERILDPEGVESGRKAVPGLGLLPVVTTFKARKRLVRVEAISRLPGVEAPVRGYEIHQGRTESGDLPAAFHLTRQFDEPIDLADGAAQGVACFGTYLHGLFDHGGFRRAYLNALRQHKDLGPLPPHAYDTRPKDFDQLADWLLDNVDRPLLESVVGLSLRN
ncbi:MAG TPA: cobyric acid synthase [Anaerolineales bacterium]